MDHVELLDSSLEFPSNLEDLLTSVVNYDKLETVLRFLLESLKKYQLVVTRLETNVPEEVSEALGKIGEKEENFEREFGGFKEKLEKMEKDDFLKEKVKKAEEKEEEFEKIVREKDKKLGELAAEEVEADLKRKELERRCSGIEIALAGLEKKLKPILLWNPETEYFSANMPEVELEIGELEDEGSFEEETEEGGLREIKEEEDERLIGIGEPEGKYKKKEEIGEPDLLNREEKKNEGFERENFLIEEGGEEYPNIETKPPNQTKRSKQGRNLAQENPYIDKELPSKHENRGSAEASIKKTTNLSEKEPSVDELEKIDTSYNQIEREETIQEEEKPIDGNYLSKTKKEPEKKFVKSVTSEYLSDSENESLEDSNKQRKMTRPEEEKNISSHEIEGNFNTKVAPKFGTSNLTDSKKLGEEKLHDVPTNYEGPFENASMGPNSSLGIFHNPQSISLDPKSRREGELSTEKPVLFEDPSFPVDIEREETNQVFPLTNEILRDSYTENPNFQVNPNLHQNEFELSEYSKSPKNNEYVKEKLPIDDSSIEGNRLTNNETNPNLKHLEEAFLISEIPDNTNQNELDASFPHGEINPRFTFDPNNPLPLSNAPSSYIGSDYRIPNSESILTSNERELEKEFSERSFQTQFPTERYPDPRFQPVFEQSLNPSLENYENPIHQTSPKLENNPYSQPNYEVYTDPRFLTASFSENYNENPSSNILQNPKQKTTEENKLDPALVSSQKYDDLKLEEVPYHEKKFKLEPKEQSKSHPRIKPNSESEKNPRFQQSPLSNPQRNEYQDIPDPSNPNLSIPNNLSLPTNNESIQTASPTFTPQINSSTKENPLAFQPDTHEITPKDPSKRHTPKEIKKFNKPTIQNPSKERNEEKTTEFDEEKPNHFRNFPSESTRHPTENSRNPSMETNRPSQRFPARKIKQNSRITQPRSEISDSALESPVSYQEEREPSKRDFRRNRRTNSSEVGIETEPRSEDFERNRRGINPDEEEFNLKKGENKRKEPGRKYEWGDHEEKILPEKNPEAYKKQEESKGFSRRDRLKKELEDPNKRAWKTVNPTADNEKRELEKKAEENAEKERKKLTKAIRNIPTKTKPAEKYIGEQPITYQTHKKTPERNQNLAKINIGFGEETVPTTTKELEKRMKAIEKMIIPESQTHPLPSLIESLKKTAESNKQKIKSLLTGKLDEEPFNKLQSFVYSTLQNKSPNQLPSSFPEKHELSSLKQSISTLAPKSDLEEVSNTLTLFINDLNTLRSDFDSSRNRQTSFDSIYSVLSRRIQLLEDFIRRLQLPDNTDLTKIWKEIQKLKQLLEELKSLLENNHKECRNGYLELKGLLLYKPNFENLQELEERLLLKIKETFETILQKAADKNETRKAIRYVESLAKQALIPREKQEAEDAMFSKKPLGGYSCASCDANLEHLIGMKVPHYSWNKLPKRERSERLSKGGPGFSRMLSNLEPRSSTPNEKQDSDRVFLPPVVPERSHTPTPSKIN